jgi:hypothetical protein
MKGIWWRFFLCFLFAEGVVVVHWLTTSDDLSTLIVTAVVLAFTFIVTAGLIWKLAARER